MTRAALQRYQDAREQQLLRNEARHIRTRVYEARQAPHIAAIRWPFELLQNALDAGPRMDQKAVTIRITHNAQEVIFEHDGAPFTSAELAALLSGGSSKEFGSEETTGRFGTGFLVTHVLSEQATIEGLLAVDHEFERFRLTLDRGGDEDAILENIEACSEAIERAESVRDASSVPSARFVYPSQRNDILARGVSAFLSAIPYLYATRSELGHVHLTHEDGTTETWSADTPMHSDFEHAYIEERTVYARTTTSERKFRVVRSSIKPDADAAALVLLRPSQDDWEVVLPSGTEPKIYREYPLRASSFLPVNFIFDGRFEPDQERSRVLMNEQDKRMLSEAFDAAVTAVRFACQRAWAGAHLLARSEPPSSAFDPDDPTEREWWSATLHDFASQLAELPIVRSRGSYLPAVTDAGNHADFLSPRLGDPLGVEETTIARMWLLAQDTTSLDPPAAELATDWSSMADGWAALGVPVAQITVGELGRSARGDAKDISALNVSANPEEWIARYIDLVGECWERRAGSDPSVLEGLLPNQRGDLCSLRGLRRDGGVPEELKDIGASIGLDVRRGLLSSRLSELLEDMSLDYGLAALSTAVPAIADAAAVSDELIEALREALPEDATNPPEKHTFEEAGAQLLGYLWRTARAEGAPIARRVPLVSASKKVIYSARERMMMAPVTAWPPRAQPFSEAYPVDRILDDRYSELVSAFDSWTIAYPGPLVAATTHELSGSRLKEMVVDGFNVEGVTVRGETFSQIALLPIEVMNHIQDDEQARALLGMVLCYIAREDSGWRQVRLVTGTRAREAVSIQVRGALWIGDLRWRAWVPVRGEDDKPARVAADSANLKKLLDPAWLLDNDDAIELLTTCFDFDELDLRLLGIGDEAQARVRQGLARLLEAGGSDPAFYESLAEEIEIRQRRSRDVERCRRLGYAVQEAVRQALESHGLNVKLVDRGFDYEVVLPAGNDTIEDGASRFELGPYFVEVKATTTGGAKLTPTQARTAAEKTGQYVLCVVDLRSVPSDQLDGDWTGEDVQPLVAVVPDIGKSVHATYQLVDQARRSNVSIRNEAALRYEVPASSWEGASSISEWVHSLAGRST